MERMTPTDAVSKGKFYYLMKNKAICGLPQPGGKNIQYLYQNGRIANASRIIGNIEDEEMLKMVETADGFKKLIAGIGISAELSEDTKASADKTLFAFQFYGHKDPYVTGTTFTKEVPLTGVEEYIDLSTINWSEDDDVPGQIRFEFEVPEVSACVTVKLYLQPGFDAPEAVPDRKPDLTSDAYKNIISRSIMNYGNLTRIQNAMEDARNGKEVTLAFIGGSITQGAGAIPINNRCYAYLTYLKFCKICGKKPDENIKYVKAGVGGTPSELGILRYDRDVTQNGKIKPDIVIVEFAVNDSDDETKGVCFESLVKKIMKGDKAPAVMIPFMVFADDFNLQDRLSTVGYKYNLPMVSLKNAVLPEFYLTDKEKAVIHKNEYFYDQFHPTNLGHRVAADCLGEIFKAADIYAKKNLPVKLDVAPAIGADFEDVKLFDTKDSFEGAEISVGSFTETDKELQSVEMNFDLTQTPEFPYNWHHVSGKDEFVLKINCSKLFIIFKDSSSPEYGTAEVLDNDKISVTMNPRKVGWTHCHAMLVFNENAPSDHKVVVRMQKGDEDKKFTILGFGAVK
ncbi:MAG: SGNH/GDSL hydrolase family protein [Lachnospiraceae bacterium]|nr:SGNH/GDSL hydrolase family protein [Lachnospiraceae bacterium]